MISHDGEQANLRYLKSSANGRPPRGGEIDCLDCTAFGPLSLPDQNFYLNLLTIYVGAAHVDKYKYNVRPYVARRPKWRDAKIVQSNAIGRISATNLRIV